MKYIIIRESSGSEFAAFCLAPQTHAQLAAAWGAVTAATPPLAPGHVWRRVVIAAGFCEFVAPLPNHRAEGAQDTCSFVRVFGRSDSLNLGPRPKDAALISMLYHGTVEMNRAADQAEALATVTELAGPALDPISLP